MVVLICRSTCIWHSWSWLKCCWGIGGCKGTWCSFCWQTSWGWWLNGGIHGSTVGPCGNQLIWLRMGWFWVGILKDWFEGTTTVWWTGSRWCGWKSVTWCCCCGITLCCILVDGGMGHGAMCCNGGWIGGERVVARGWTDMGTFPATLDMQILERSWLLLWLEFRSVLFSP